jgi:hypothetical protein
LVSGAGIVRATHQTGENAQLLAKRIDFFDKLFDKLFLWVTAMLILASWLYFAPPSEAQSAASGKWNVCQRQAFHLRWVQNENCCVGYGLIPAPPTKILRQSVKRNLFQVLQVFHTDRRIGAAML